MDIKQILNINEVVQSILNQIDTRTIDNCPVLMGYPAGGCARDVLYGASTKDVDILVPIGEHLTESEAFHVAESICGYLRRVLDVTAYCVFAYQRGDTEKGHDFDERLYFCVKTCIDGIDVDILGSRYGSIKEILDNFDCTMNQVYIDPVQGELVGSKVTGLEWLKPVPDARVLRMQDKFNKLVLGKF
ncbi:putative nucleotidyltransferase [Proteus phage PM16]|uniref:Putative nucleotidyltransferase n=1 Tax=Proteus phage PM16 TaxID=1357704 RepID=A0A0A6ZKD5_9CAUD|nr:nucleotidyltransferase [Proteus phage PM16]AGZ17261.1 putative nucleotidyltransferase [Proteus phage PM16]